MSRDRDLVVFLPAVGGDSSFWRPQVEALAKIGRASCRERVSLNV